MNTRQMVHAIKQYNISLIFDEISGLWYAGPAFLEAVSGAIMKFSVQTKYRNSTHVSHEPEGAVEDYCNARNLEWGV